MSKWYLGSKPYWRFWDPRSGFAGGAVLGSIILIIGIVVFELLT